MSPNLTEFMVKQDNLKLTGFIFCFLVSMTLLNCCNAQVPSEGTKIVNVAYAEFSVQGHTYRTNSNRATVFVAAVRGVSIFPRQSRRELTLPDSQVRIPFLIQNTGNDEDQYSLKAQLLDHTFVPVNLRIIYDRGQSGIVNSQDPTLTTTPLIKEDERIRLLVCYRIPKDTYEGSYAQVRLKVISQQSPAVREVSRPHKTVVSEGVHIELTKTASKTIISGGEEVQWNIFGVNKGNRPAKPVTIKVDNQVRRGLLVEDQFPDGKTSAHLIPDSLEGSAQCRLLYSVDGGKHWSASPPEYSRIDTVGCLVPSLKAEHRFQFSYRLRVRSSASVISDPVTITYRSDSKNRKAVTVWGFIKMKPMPKFVIGPKDFPFGKATGEDYINESGQPITCDQDQSTLTESSVGQKVTFQNTIMNTGSESGIVNLQAGDASTIPHNWAVTFHGPDGKLLTDSNQDGMVDIGPLREGRQVDVYVRIYLPTVVDREPLLPAEGVLVISVSSPQSTQSSDITRNRILKVVRQTAWSLYTDVSSHICTYGELLNYTLTFENSSDKVFQKFTVVHELSPYLLSPRKIVDGTIKNQAGDGAIIVEGEYQPSKHRVIWNLISDTVEPGFKGQVSFSVQVCFSGSLLASVENPQVIKGRFGVVGTSSSSRVYGVSPPIFSVVSNDRLFDARYEVSPSNVEPGDVLNYKLTITRSKNTPNISNCVIWGHFPDHLHFLPKTLVVNGARVADVQVLDKAAKIGLSLSHLSKSRVMVEFGVTIAPQIPPGKQVSSLTVEAQGKITTPDPRQNSSFTTTIGPIYAEVNVVDHSELSGTSLLGEVFQDRNFNQIRDANEPGIEGVKVILEDGRFTVTNNAGRYHFGGLRSGVHQVQLDPPTLPPDITAPSLSQTITSLPSGPPLQADFAVSNPLSSEKFDKNNEKTGPGSEKDFRIPDFPASTSGRTILFPQSEARFTSRDKISVMVETDLLDDVSLKINDRRVSSRKIGTRMYDQQLRRARYVYVSIPLRAGANLLQLYGTSSNGEVFRVCETVYLSASPKELKLNYDTDQAIADGVSHLNIHIRVVDKNGFTSPVTGFVTINAREGEIVSPDSNPHQIGHQILLQAGVGSVWIQVPSSPYVLNVKASMGELKKTLQIPFLPPNKDWVWVGAGRLGIAGFVTTKEDNIKIALSNAQWEGSGGIWGQGSVGSLGLATVAVNSRGSFQNYKSNSELAPSWNDEVSVKQSLASPWWGSFRFDAANGSQFLLGNFAIDWVTNRFSTLKRELAGVKLRYGKPNRFHLDWFTSRTTTSLAVDNFLINKGSSIYQLSHHPVNKYSDQVWMDLQKKSGEILSRYKLVRGKDYRIDYQTGMIFLYQVHIPRTSPGDSLKLVVNYQVVAPPGDSSMNILTGARIADLSRSLGWDITFLRDQLGSADPWKLWNGSINYRLPSSHLTVEIADNDIPLGGSDFLFHTKYDIDTRGPLDFSGTYKYKGAQFFSSPEKYMITAGPATQVNNLTFQGSGNLISGLRHSEKVKFDFTSEQNTSKVSLSGDFWRGQVQVTLEDFLRPDTPTLGGNYRFNFSGMKGELRHKFKPDQTWYTSNGSLDFGLVRAFGTRSSYGINESHSNRYGVELNLPDSWMLTLAQEVRNTGGLVTSLFEWQLENELVSGNNSHLRFIAEGSSTVAQTDSLKISLRAETELGSADDYLNISGSLLNEPNPFDNITLRLQQLSPAAWDLRSTVNIHSEKIKGILNYTYRPLDTSLFFRCGLDLEYDKELLTLIGTIEQTWDPWAFMQWSSNGLLRLNTLRGDSQTLQTLIGQGHFKVLWDLPDWPISLGGHLGCTFQTLPHQVTHFWGVDGKLKIVNNLAVVTGINIGDSKRRPVPAGAYSTSGPFIAIELATGDPHC